MPTLVTIPFSHYCEKARWALDRARVAYREEGHAPGAHRFAVRRVRGAGGSVPVLVLDQGGVLDDSSLIVRWADAQASDDRKLLPSAARLRDEALSLEHHFDVDLGPHVRRVAYAHLIGRPDLLRTLFGTHAPPREAVVVRALLPVLRRLMKRGLRVREPFVTRSRDAVRRLFEEVGQKLADGRPFLLGDRMTTADITFAALAGPLLAPAERSFQPLPEEAIPAAMAEEIRAARETPAGAFGLRMYREHRRDA